MNFIQGSVTREDGRFYFVNKRIKLPVPEHHYPGFNRDRNGISFIMGVRPEHALLKADTGREEEEGWVRCEVEMTEITGADSYVYVRLGEQTVIVRTDPDKLHRKDDKLLVSFAMNKVHFFEEQSGDSVSLKGDAQ